MKRFILLFLVSFIIGLHGRAQTNTPPFVLTSQGVGPVQLGVNPNELPESVPGLYASKTFSDPLAQYLSDDEDDWGIFEGWEFKDEDGNNVLTADVDSTGLISEITVKSPNILTGEGLHVGMPRKEIEAVQGVLKIEPDPLADYPQDSYLLNGATFTLDSYYSEGELIGQDVVATITLSDPILTPEGLGVVRLGNKATDLPESVPRLYASKVQGDGNTPPKGADWHFLDDQGNELFTTKQDKNGEINEITVTASSISSLMGLHVGMPLQQVEYISGLQWDKPDQTKGSLNCYDVYDITLNVNRPENQEIDKASSLVASMTVVGAPSSDVLYETVNEVIAEALPYYLTSSSLQEMESHLDEIRNIKSVESAYSNGSTTLFVDIKNAGPISFSFYPDESFEISQESLEQLKTQLKPIPEEYTGTQLLNKFTIAYQMGNDVKRVGAGEKDILEIAKKMFESCNHKGDNDIIKPTVDFFLKDMYNYDYVFLNTHGYYDSETKKHWLLTSTRASLFSEEYVKRIRNNYKQKREALDNDKSISNTEKERLIKEIREQEFKKITCLNSSVFTEYKELYNKGLINIAFQKEAYGHNLLAGMYNEVFPKAYNSFFETNNFDKFLADIWLYMQPCYISVSEDLIKQSDMKFAHQGYAIVFNTACQSVMGDDDNQPNYSLADAFLQKGAGAYLGYDEINGTGKHGGLEFFGRLFSGMSINRAYETLDDIVVNDSWVDKERKDKHEWTAHLRKRCATVRRANDYDGESSDFGDYGTYRPKLSNLSWNLREQHLNIAIMASIPLHWYTSKQIIKDDKFVDPEVNVNIEAIPLEYGFEISKTAEFKEKQELGRIGINDVKEDEIIDRSGNVFYGTESSKIESKLIDGAVAFGMAYKNKITKTYFADADTCCLRAFVFDGKNYTYSKYIVLRRNVSGQSYFGEIPDLVTRAHNKAVNAGLGSSHFYAIDEVARNEYRAVDKEVGKKIQEIKNLYIGKRIPVEGVSITHAVIDEISNHDDGARTSIILRLYPSAVAANATWGNALYFVFLDEENKLLDKKMAVSDPNENYDGRIWINLIPVESYSPSRWNRFAKIVQVTKEEYNKWK